MGYDWFKWITDNLFEIICSNIEISFFDMEFCQKVMEQPELIMTKITKQYSV